jgi:hypothetical protein
MPDVKRAKRIVSKAYYQLRERKLIGQCFVILLQTSHSVLAATITSTSVSLHAPTPVHDGLLKQQTLP